jgi:hypothetical protein
MLIPKFPLLKRPVFRPDLKIGLLGCMAERLKKQLLEGDRLVDVVAGPGSFKSQSHSHLFNPVLLQTRTEIFLASWPRPTRARAPSTLCSARTRRTPTLCPCSWAPTKSPATCPFSEAATTCAAIASCRSREAESGRGRCRRFSKRFVIWPTRASRRSRCSGKTSTATETCRKVRQRLNGDPERFLGNPSLSSTTDKGDKFADL